MSNLKLNELIVVQGDNYIFHEKFDHKINIIRGDNSTGKSSIANFIFFILGGDFTDFLPEAKRCDYVLAELTINGTLVTIRRNLDQNDNLDVKSKRPMELL
jgi:AAA15 family ATPase/GTPase